MRTIESRSPVEQPGPSRWYGVYPGKVTSVKDQDHQGQIQVQLAFAPDTNGDTFKVWARLATMMAGPSRGSFFVPDVGDEVLVAFYAGDVRRPYVIGALWNGQDAPPQQMDDNGQNNLRVIHTRSGHKLEFDDTKGSPKITLTTPAGNQLILDDSSGGSVTLKGPANSSISFDQSGNITINASMNLNITATQINANVPMSQFNGVTQHQTMISSAVVGSTYTCGAGNVW